MAGLSRLVRLNAWPQKPEVSQINKLFIISPITQPKEWQSLTRGSIISAIIPSYPSPLGSSSSSKPLPVAVWKPPTEDDPETILCPFKPEGSRQTLIKKSYQKNKLLPVRLQIVPDPNERAVPASKPGDPTTTQRYSITHLYLPKLIKLPAPPKAFKLLVPHDLSPNIGLGKAVLTEKTITGIQKSIERELANKSEPPEKPTKPESNTSSKESAVEVESSLPTSPPPASTPTPPTPLPSVRKGKYPTGKQLKAGYKGTNPPPRSFKGATRFFIFKGGPGTKTAIDQRIAAEKIARIYYEAGLLSSCEVYERNLAELGQKATKQVMGEEATKAVGKVLFIRDTGRSMTKLIRPPDDAAPPQPVILEDPSALGLSKHGVLRLHRAAVSTWRPCVVVVAGSPEGMDRMISNNSGMFGGQHWKWDVLNFDDPAEVASKIEQLGNKVFVVEDKEDKEASGRKQSEQSQEPEESEEPKPSEMNPEDSKPGEPEESKEPKAAEMNTEESKSGEPEESEEPKPAEMNPEESEPGKPEVKAA
ncbi:hypothetical protein QBC43DRAFT_312577 [Cladorrhinum sp. PSN259]|nr:hypothetical protein QBC43DRAFT_312577 [Cladorrhinum sp. PSN259]